MSRGLTPEERLRLEVLFERASALEPEDHAAFLDTECGPEGELREQLSVLLLGLASDDLLGQAQVRLMSRTGTRVGPYELGEKIGEGGMGDVYAAEQSEPVRRRVALKVIRPGLDTEPVFRRFEMERQALARMSHPNVSQFFDAGATEDGCPYFAMEYVEGLAITDHCDRAGLSIRARLELFLGVCEGVQHAHQKGIIHRDLKPSNLLVTVDGGRAVAKVIDFGIARATADRREHDATQTLVGQIVGTLDFMSPEQADPACAEIDTRSDIYSLGVLL